MSLETIEEYAGIVVEDAELSDLTSVLVALIPVAVVQLALTRYYQRSFEKGMRLLHGKRYDGKETWGKVYQLHIDRPGLIQPLRLLPGILWFYASLFLIVPMEWALIVCVLAVLALVGGFAVQARVTRALVQMRLRQASKTEDLKDN